MRLKWGTDCSPRRITYTADFDFLENYTEDINSQIHSNIAPEGLRIATGNDVIIYFRSAANPINVSLLGQVQVTINC